MHRATFENVDLDLQSATDLHGLVVALESAAIPIHVGKKGRRYWVRLVLMPEPKSPTQAITRFAKAIAALPRKHRQQWKSIAIKEFDIGIQGGDEPGAMEWVVDPAAVKTAARLGASIRITVYSPRLLDRQ